MKEKRGWGLQLVSELMDTVEYNSDESGTTVTMTKKEIMSDSIKNVEEKDGIVIISTAGYFNNLAGDAVLEVFTKKSNLEVLNF